MYIVVARARCVGRVIRLLPWGLWILLIVSLIPVTWLKGVPLLVERVLWSVVGDASPSSYGFNHLSCFGVLYSLGFILVVVFGEWEGDDRVQDTWGETVQEEAYGLFASDGVTSAADEFFEVGYVLIDLREAHFAAV